MNVGGLTNGKTSLTLSDKEQRLIEAIRELPYGEMRLVMHQGEPDRIEIVRQSVKF